jgi:hypothetical protein
VIGRIILYLINLLNADLKRLHWDVLDDTTGTVWDELGGDGEGLDDVFGDLKDAFSTKKVAKDATTGGGDASSKPKVRTTFFIYLHTYIHKYIHTYIFFT